jgi:hypothetical protein
MRNCLAGCSEGRPMREFCHLACFQPVALAIPIHSRRSERERSNALLAHALRIGPRGAAGKAQEVCYVPFVSRQDTQDATSRMTHEQGAPE